jgi:hypothetical protein
MPRDIGSVFTISGVTEYTLHNGVECWVVGLVNERGQKYPYQFPKFAVEQRIAEYDLDPTDIAGAIDIILHEPHIPDPTDSVNFATDAAAKKGMMAASVKARGAIKRGQQVPLHLGNAPDRATAKAAHQARVDEVKSRITFNSGKGKGLLSKGDTTDPLKTILDNHGVTDEGLSARTSYVKWLMAAGQGKVDRTNQRFIQTPGAHPVTIPIDTKTGYDTSIRRRGLTVALLDT